MEIKSGAARLNKHQRMIRDAIKDGNVLVEKL
jgi:predicted Holliday junction resolvase-like endonuclease